MKKTIFLKRVINITTKSGDKVDLMPGREKQQQQLILSEIGLGARKRRKI